MSLARAAFALSFEISPIILTGGLAAGVPGGMLPIVSLTEAANFVTGLLSGGSDLSLDEFFAHFRPLPGGSLIEQDFGQYPFANQAVAANAVIPQPKSISMLMVCPVKSPFGYATKLVTMTALQAALAQHNLSGGTYTIATPSFFYTNCLMRSFRDASNQNSAQAQNAFILDFEQPLLTLEQANEAENSLMSKLSGRTAISGDPAWSGLPPTVGVPPSLAASSLIPAATNLSGAGLAGVAGIPFG
jgi:hypothetical protein